MLYKLSVRNIRKSIKDYAVYFFTLVVGVAIFYVFNAIDSQAAMLNVSERTEEIIELMTNMLSSVSVLVSIILGGLIIFASCFLIKRRNKEFGIYLTLGMGKRRISMILFCETLLIGMLSLVVGLLAGIGISQFMSAFVANMFEADMTKYEFVFSYDACKRTLLYFGIMYGVVMIFNVVSISHCKLIDLLQAEKKTEKIRMKNPWFCVLVFFAAAGLLGRAYYMVTAGFSEMQDANYIYVPIVMGIVGTFLVFWSLSGLMLRIFMSMKRVYYKGLNSFILRQISSQVNTTVGSMSIICLMLFVTIGALCACFSIKNSMQMELDELAPVDIDIVKRLNFDDTDKEVSKKEIEISNLSILEFYDAAGLSLDEKLSETVSVHIYRDEGFTMGKSLGDSLESIQNQYLFIQYETPEDIMGLSEYNKAAELLHNPTFTLAEDEYLIVADFQSMAAIRNSVLEKGETVEIFGKTLKPKYTACQDGFVEIGGNHLNTGIFVVPDAVIKEDAVEIEHLLGNYAVDTKEERQKIENEIIDATGNVNIEDSLYPALNTRLTISESTVGLGAIVTFIGLYLGVVFLISSAVILALKQLSESADNIERYQVLRQLGADEGMIRKALFGQIGIFFAAPLFLAVIHSVFGIRFSMIILEIFGTVGMPKSIATTAVIILGIYGGYFLMTYWCSKNVIRARE